MEDNFDGIKINEGRYRLTLELWRNRAHRGAKAHYLASERCLARGRKITLWNAIFSILVLFFANASWVQPMFFGKDSNAYVIAISISSLMLVLLTIAQYLYRDEEQGQKHKEAGAQFANLMRKIERYLAGEECTMAFLHAINRSYSQITSSYPLVASHIWDHPKFKTLQTEITDLEKEVDLATHTCGPAAKAEDR